MKGKSSPKYLASFPFKVAEELEEIKDEALQENKSPSSILTDKGEKGFKRVMFSHYQSLSLCNESFLVFWSKRLGNPHLSQPPVSDPANYNLDLNPCPLGPQTLSCWNCWICPATVQVILILRAFRTPSAHFNCSLKTFTTTVRHSLSKPGSCLVSWHWVTGLGGTGDGGGGVGGGFDAWLRLPPPLTSRR